MINETLENVDIILAYAGVNRTFIVPDAVKTSNTILNRLRENKIGDTCRIVLKFCISNAVILSPYGLIPEKISSQEASIVDFETKLVGTPEYLAEQQLMKNSFKTQYNIAEDLLSNTLDPLVELLKKKKPEIYTLYHKTRKIEVKGRRILSLLIQVSDANTGEALKGVELTIVKVENGDGKLSSGTIVPKIIKRTAAQGGSRFKNLSAGLYSVTAVLPGFGQVISTIWITDGKMSTLEIKLPRL